MQVLVLVGRKGVLLGAFVPFEQWVILQEALDLLI